MYNHGDLSHKNILADGDRVWIIDWEKSKLHYLARDFDNLSYDTIGIYEEFITKAQIDKKEVYSYKEQLFLARYIEMNRLIHNGIKRKTITPYLYTSTNQQIQTLMKMAEKL